MEYIPSYSTTYSHFCYPPIWEEWDGIPFILFFNYYKYHYIPMFHSSIFCITLSSVNETKHHSKSAGYVHIMTRINSILSFPNFIYAINSVFFVFSSSPFHIVFLSSSATMHCSPLLCCLQLVQLMS